MSASASQTGPRGRGASAPTGIPAKGWKDISLRVLNQFSDDRVMLVAGGVTYYLLLALVPALTAIVSIFGLVADPVTIREQLSTVSSFVPGGGMEIIKEQLERLAGQNDAALGFAFVFSLGVSIWSTNAGMKAIFDAMNIAYDEEETRSFVKLTLLSLGYTIAFVLGAIVLVGMLIALPIALNYDIFGGLPEITTKLVSYAVLAVLIGFSITMIYRHGPDRDPAKWRWITPGAVFSTIVVAIASFGFSYYVANFGSYNATYGSLGALIGFITWIWISIIILIMGAEINAEIEKQTRLDTTIGNRQPMGARDATAADKLGARAGNIGGSESVSQSAGQDAGHRGAGGERKRAAKISPSALLVMVPFAIAAGLLSRR